MKYGSVCSGIEAASQAWEPIGFTPAWFSEIEPFPCAVLAHHWPHVQNLGDMTKIAGDIHANRVEAPDLLVGGTPCQAFSVAGLRAGLDDARGQLTISYVELADAIDRKRRERGEKPAIIVWENVPGVLSSKDNAFGCFLAGLAGEDEPLQPSGKKWTNVGYVFGPARTIAWRIFDAQYFGVAQRRRRVFVVASARSDIDPGKILFEFDGMQRNTPPSRETGENITAAAGSSAKSGSHWDSRLNPHPTLNQSNNIGGIGLSNQEVFSQRGGGLVGQKWPADIACTLNAAFGSKLGLEDQHINGGAPLFVPVNPEFYEAYQHHGWRESNCAGPLTANLEKGVMGSTPLIGHKVTAFNWQADGNTSATLGANSHITGALQASQHPAVCITEPYTLAIRGRRDGSSFEYRQDGTANALLTPNGGRCGLGVGAIAYATCVTGDVTHCLKGEGYDGSEDGTGRGQPIIAFSSKDYGADAALEVSPTLRAGNSANSNQNAGAPPAIAYSDVSRALLGKPNDSMAEDLDTYVLSNAMAFAENSRAEVRLENGDGQITGALSTGGGKPGQGTPAIAIAGNTIGRAPKNGGNGTGFSIETGYTLTKSDLHGVMHDMQVRRLMPMECERLQGMADTHTQIPWKNKSTTDCPDGPRYKAIGNSMAVPVMRWIGERILLAVGGNDVQEQK